MSDSPEIAFGPLALTPSGISVNGPPTEAAVGSVLEFLAFIYPSVNWWIGDAINAAEQSMDGGRGLQMVSTKLDGIKPCHLMDCQRVAAAFPLETRVWPLSWTHYKHAARLPYSQVVGVMTAAVESNQSSAALADTVREILKLNGL